MKRFLATILSFVLLAGCAQNDAENTIVQRDNGEPFYGSFEDVNAHPLLRMYQYQLEML